MNRFPWNHRALFCALLLVVAGLAACRPDEGPVERTVVVTETVEVEGSPVVQVVTPTPVVPTPVPRTLVVCLGQEPESLYPFGEATLAQQSVLQAIYDGPVDYVDYQDVPVILEKIPALGDGDARIEPVAVAPGDPIVDAEGNLAVLGAGVRVRPSGCHGADCVATYEGSEPIELDRLTLEFTLIPGLEWSDGTPLTAADSVYAYRLAADPATPVEKFEIERTATYEAVDESVVRWVGLPGFLDSTFADNFWAPRPEHEWGSRSAAELLEAGIANRAPLGWGPYVIEEWTAGDQIRLRKNPRYHRAEEGLPRFEHLIYRFVPEGPDVAVAMVLSGECDVLDRSVNLYGQVELLQALEGEGEVDFHLAAGSDWEHADFGIVPASHDDGYDPGFDTPSLVGDPRTRQGIAFCMDRSRVVEEVLFGESLVLDTYLPPGHPLQTEDVTRYGYDVEAGQELLEEAGWVDSDADPTTPRVYQGNDPQVPFGTPLEFRYLTTSAVQRVQAAEILIESMAECGIGAVHEVWSTGELYADGPEGPLFGRQFDLAQFAWQAGRIPACHLYLSEAVPGDPAARDESGERRFLYGWGGWNVTGFADDGFDAICNAARSAVPGQPVYAENHLEAQRVFAEALPVVPLYLHLRTALSRPDLCGLTLDSTSASALWNLEGLDYGEACGEG